MVNVPFLTPTAYVPPQATPTPSPTYIPLPKELAVKTAIINMKNKDNKCFSWCVLRALYPRDSNSERIDRELRIKEESLNMKGIDYPVSLKDISRFEKQNPSIAITVLGYEGKSVYPLRNSACTNRENNIVILLIEKDGVSHYCLIKNLSRLLSSKVSKHHVMQHFCLRFMNSFWCEEALSKHEEYCDNYEAVKIELPKKGTMLKFKKLSQIRKGSFHRLR